MATLEMVEKLRQRANVSYDEAKYALEQCGDDLLEAMIYLERQGKVNNGGGTGYYSTEWEQQYQNPNWNAAHHQHRGEGFVQLMQRFCNWVGRLIQKGWVNSFEVWKGEERVISMPVLILVILLAFCFWITIPLLIVGLFFSLRYRFCGPELNDLQVNNVMDKASETAENIKAEVINLSNDHHDKH